VADNQRLLQVSAEQRDKLESWAHSRSLPAGDVFRARLILVLADGLTATTDRLRGLVLAYLGQIDDRVPYAPSDFVARDEF